MLYQSLLLPTDYEGGFVSVCCHGRHAVGGENTREVGYARVRTGHIDGLDSMRDLSSTTLPARPASREREAHETRGAEGQAELARSGRFGASASKEFLANERAMLHAAKLAAVDTVRVPRQTLGSRAGKVLLVFEQSDQRICGEGLPAVLRLIDTTDGRVLGDWASSRLPIDRPGKGIQRYSTLQLTRAHAMALDGTSVLLPGDVDNPFSVIEVRLAENLSEIVEQPIRATSFVSVQNGWAVISDENVRWMSREWKLLAERPLPRKVLSWAATASLDGEMIALPAQTGGDVWIVGKSAAKPRRFSPHRGAARDAHAQPTLSDCGRWMATHCDREVVVTRLEDGTSWPVATIQNQIHQDDSFDAFVIRSHVAASCAFIGSRLIAVEDGALREIPVDGQADKAFVSEQGRPAARRPIRISGSMGFDALMHAARLNRCAAMLKPFYSPAVRLRSKPLKRAGWRLPGQAGAPPLGASRFGGWPDLPDDTVWPMSKSRPMAFLGQINLTEAHAVEPALRLPAAGLLSFFIGCTADTYDKDGDSRPRYMADVMAGTADGAGDEWKVIHTPSTANLQRRIWQELPLPQLFEPRSLRFVKGGMPLPDETTMVYPLLALNRDERDDYNELIGHLKPDEERTLDQMMGYPTLIQYTPPEMMCELSARGLDPWHNHPQPSSEQYSALADGAVKWTLLLQLTSNSDADFCWGRAGHLYFYGDRLAMERGDFSRMWINFEN